MAGGWAECSVCVTVFEMALHWANWRGVCWAHGWVVPTDVHLAAKMEPPMATEMVECSAVYWVARSVGK